MAKLKLKVLYLCPFLLLSFVEAFIVGSSVGFRKCYFSDVSHDKTLEVKFGFPRREKENCVIKLEIDYEENREIKNDHYSDETDISLYNHVFYCNEMNPRQLFVFKHTPHEQEYSGSYRVCVENLQDFNNQDTPNNTLFQLIIAQKYDPSLMIDVANTPLVEASQLMDLQSLITNIKRTLGWCQVRMKEAQEIGNQLIAKLIQASDASYKATYVQIIFLILYGAAWVYFVKTMAY